MGNPWADSTERGVYRTTDGRDVTEYIGRSVGIADLVMDPQNPQACGGVSSPPAVDLFGGAGRRGFTNRSISSVELLGHGLPRKAGRPVGLPDRAEFA